VGRRRSWLPFSSFSVQCNLGLNSAVRRCYGSECYCGSMDSGQREKLVGLVGTVLAAEQYQNFRRLYGTVVMARAKQAETPACSVLSFLTEHVDHLLREWEQRCDAYLKAVVSKADAVAKAETELVGPARKCSPGQFNAVLGDFFAEMCAVGALSRKGYSSFQPIPPAKTKTPDYRCNVNFHSACVEFKNIRAPRTILDTFIDLLPDKLQANPALRKKRIVLTYYWDNTVTDGQREEIDTFLTTLDTSSTNHDLDLSGEVKVKVGLVDGDGSIMMTRGVRPGDWTFVEEDKLMNKVEAVVEKAVGQLRQFDCEERVLAINVMTADMMMPESWADAIRKIVQEKSSGDVRCEVLFAYDNVLR
jgi:hypothetical protein